MLMLKKIIGEKLYFSTLRKGEQWISAFFSTLLDMFWKAPSGEVESYRMFLEYSSPGQEIRHITNKRDYVYLTFHFSSR